MENNKFKFLVNYSLKKKFKNKWFIGVNILLLLMFVCLINFDKIITSFGGDFEDISNIIVLDNTDEFYYYLEEYLSLTNNTEVFTFDYTLELNQELIKEDISMDNLEKNDIVLIINDIDGNLIIDMITKESIDTITYQVLVSLLDSSKVAYLLNALELDADSYFNVSTPIEINREILNENYSQEDDNLILTMTIPILILPFFMLSIFLVQIIGAEVNEEKSTKSMEIILSNVSAKMHFLSKIISGNIFVLTQGFLLFVYSLIGLLFRVLFSSNSINNGFNEQFSQVYESMKNTGIIDNLWFLIPLILLLLVISLLGYSLIAAILSAMTTNQEDFQQIQTPIMVISLVGYYLAMMSSLFKGSLFIKICSYIPFISAILSPSLLIAQEITIFDFLIAIIFMFITIFLLFKYGMRAYKVGILNYSSNKLWTKLYKSIKNKG